MFAHRGEQKGDDNLEASLLHVGHLIILFWVNNLIFFYPFLSNTVIINKNYHHLGFYQLIILGKIISIFLMAHCYYA